METLQPDTPMLREIYRDLLRDAVELSGKGIDGSSFKTMCEAEMIYVGDEPSPRTWVNAAERVVDFLKYEPLYEQFLLEQDFHLDVISRTIGNIEF